MRALLLALLLAPFAALAQSTVTLTPSITAGDGQVTVGNVKYYPLERVQPPEGEKSLDWIKSGMKPGKW